MTLPISVVIPCYKQEQYLERAIESAWNAGAENVFVYGDAKPYGLSIKQPCEQMYGSIHTGVCFGRNILIDRARTELIFPLDADDRLYPDGLHRLYEAWRPGTWMYGETYIEIDEDDNNIRLMKTPPPGAINRKNLSYSSFLFHRDDWEKAGGYDPLFEFGDEDYAFQVALTDAGVRPVRMDGAPVYQRMIHPRGSRTERAVKYFPMVLELLREKYPSTMRP